MIELLEDLKAFLEKHKAAITLDGEEGFLKLGVEMQGEELHILESGYRDFCISPDALDYNIHRLKIEKL